MKPCLLAWKDGALLKASRNVNGRTETARLESFKESQRCKLLSLGLGAGELVYLGMAVGGADNFHLRPVSRACPELLRRDHGDAGQDAEEVWLLPGQKARGVCVYPGRQCPFSAGK